MSSYVCFYLKTKNDGYYPIASFSRSNPEYEYIQDYLPYGENKFLSMNIIKNIMSDIEKEQTNYESSIAKYKERKALVASMNNTVEEKMEEIFSIEGSIESCNEIHKELIKAFYFYRTLYLMMDELTYLKSYGNPDEYIIAGIEAGSPNGNEDD